MADVDTLRECLIKLREPFPACISRKTTPTTATRSHEAGTLLPADKMPSARGKYSSFKPENGKVCVFSHGSRSRCVTRPAGALPRRARRPLPSAPPPPPLPLFSFFFSRGHPAASPPGVWIQSSLDRKIGSFLIAFFSMGFRASRALIQAML
jgi:hypothetical protein